ncbi:MAG TPA: DUF1552 domain-containing protein, partial [Polyangiaceae bacterium]|nr:DUF1552 domain-containing protein [Polyangiaceae bacterium]
MNRRLFLRGVGGAALAAPFLSSVYEKSAKADAVTPPKRLVIFYTHNGCLTDKWFPVKEDGPLTADDLTSTTLAPLAPYVSKLLLPRGFRSMNGYAAGQTIDPHDQAMGSKLTCATITEDSNRYATAASLDHIVAKQINPGGATPLVLSVGAASTKIKEVLSFSAPNTAFPANVNPQTVYNQLTGLFASGPTPTTEGDYRVALGESAIDLVKGDLQRYQKLNMSQADKQRVQDWLDLLRTTEGGIGLPTSCSAASAMALNITDAAVKAASPGGPIDPGAFNPGGGSSGGAANLAVSFTQGGDMMMNLMA